MLAESPTRSIAKAISWRVLASLTTIVLVLIFTGELTTAVTIGVFETFVKMALYFVHERTWNKFTFGRKEMQEISS